MADTGSKVVVASMVDGRRERGVIGRFRPFDASFDVYAPEDVEMKSPRRIEVHQCKAIYFVRVHEGNRSYQEDKLRIPPVHRSGRKIEVLFPDGERMVGTTEGFNPSRPGFIFYPADPKSNNIEIFVVTANAEEIKLLAMEPGGEDKVFRPRAEQGVFAPQKRLEAVQRLVRGETVEKVAKDLSVSPETVLDWKDRFLKGGAAALGVVEPPGGPARK